MAVKQESKKKPDYKYWIAIGASIILGLIFILSGLGKMLNQPDAVRIFFFPLSTFLTSALNKVVLIWLPRIEFLMGVLLIFGIAVKLLGALSSVLIAGFITHNILLIQQGLWARACNCFGKLAVVPYTGLSIAGALVLDVVMLALVVIILFWYRSNFFNFYPWFWGKVKSWGNGAKDADL
ncbi:MauE/DoxX family redox-associated membrane protein [Chloroflexota bacterium]